MKILATLLSVGLWLLAGLFVLSAKHPDAVASGKVLPRLVVAGLLGLGGLVLLIMAFRSGKSAEAGPSPGSVQGQEASGPLAARAIVCPNCGAKADAEAVKIGKDGVMTVTCPYCQAAFFLQEEPKW